MRNIYLVPTNKEIKTKGGLVKDKYGEIHIFSENDGKEYGKTTTGLYIYITSDEHIKDNDYILDIEDLTIGKVKDAKDKHNIEVNYGDQGIGLSCVVKGCSESLKYPIAKIILTTNPDLIEDGVQAITNKFLEWFVKNSTCEFVEVEEWSDIETNAKTLNIKRPQSPLLNLISGNTSNGVEPLFDNKYYVRNKQVKCYDKFNQLLKDGDYKDETLEEAAKKYATNRGMMAYVFPEKEKSFIDGGKWQSERTYSKEDVVNILESLVEHPTKPGYKRKDILKYIEEFKKK